jgi:hypothetical protein
MKSSNSFVAVLYTHDKAEQSVRMPKKEGFDMKKLSIVGKEYHTEEHVVGYYNAGDRMLYWVQTGFFWGGFWGLLSGPRSSGCRGVGPLLVAGPLVVSFLVGWYASSPWWHDLPARSFPRRLTACQLNDDASVTAGGFDHASFNTKM